MNLNDRVRITDLDVTTDHPPVGVITKLYYRFRNTPFEQEMAEVTFDRSLIDKPILFPEGVPLLCVETSRLEKLNE